MAPADRRFSVTATITGGSEARAADLDAVPGAPFVLPSSGIHPQIRLGLIFVGSLAVAGLLAQGVLSIQGGADERAGAGAIGIALLTLAAGTTLVRCLANSNARFAWSLIGGALCLWAISYAYLELHDSVAVASFPSVASVLQLGFLLAMLAGVWALGGRFAGTASISPGLIVALLGILTLSSLVAFDFIPGGAESSGTTLPYSLLSLGILLSMVLALAARGWRLDPSMFTLFAALVIMFAGAFAFAADGGRDAGFDGVRLHDELHTLWPLGAIGVAAAAWLPTWKAGLISGEGVRAAAVLGACLLALAALFADRFVHESVITVALAALVLIAAAPYGALIYRDRARAEAAARSAESLRRAAADTAPDSVLMVGRDLRIVEGNRAFGEVFGMRPGEFDGPRLVDLLRAEDRGLLIETVRGLFDVSSGLQSEGAFEAVAVGRNGTEFPVEVRVARTAEGPAPVTARLHDITKRREREVLNERLESLVYSSDEAMYSLRLDGTVVAWNAAAEELYGFRVDEARGRLAADLVIPADRQHEITEIIDRVKREGMISIGTVRRTKTGERLDVRVRAFPVRDARGRTKGVSVAARNVTAELRSSQESEDDRVGRKWRAVVSDGLANGNAVFFAQPVLDPRTGTVHHSELLMRIMSDGKVIGPGEFMYHVEHSELMHDVDRWAIRRGVEIAAAGPVAINLSARSLGDFDLVAFAARTCAEIGVSPTDVIFEITETAAADNLKGAERLVEALRALGFGIALDDFGTGFGSFTYLKYLPVSQLKIDMEFIRGIEDNAADRRVVESIVGVAENFGMATVAEGVEKQAAMDVLTDLGVNLIQGYLVGRPAPIDEDRNLLNRETDETTEAS